MDKIILHILMVMFLMCSTTVFSHRPNQITYNFKIGKEKSTLTIHFTPKTIIDILEFVKPELQGSSSLNLNTYDNEVYDYFSERILLDKKRLKEKFSLGEMNLVSHDAYITFVLDDAIDFSNGLHITVNSLTDIYTRLENFVFIDHLESRSRYLLSNEKRTAIWDYPKALKGKEPGFSGIRPFWTVLFLSLVFTCLSMALLNTKWAKKRLA